MTQTDPNPTPPAPTPPAPPAPTPPAPPPAPPAPTEKVFTQDEVNAMMTREKQQGRQEAAREISERLGITVDEAEQILKDHREAEDAKLSEADKKLKDAEERERKAQEREAAAAAREHRIKIRDALADAKCRNDRLDLATDGVLPKIAVDADEETVKSTIESYKTQVPEWFGESAPTPPSPSGTPPSTPPASPAPPAKPQEDRYAAGVERAKSHKF